MDGEQRESPYETDMPVSVEANHSNTHTQEGNSDPTGGNEAYFGLDMPRFNRCNRDEYFQTHRDRPPALNPSGISPVDSYRGIILIFTSSGGNQLSKHSRRDMFNGGISILFQWEWKM